MKILYDTSVLVAAFISDHPKHEPCYRYFSLGLLGEHKIEVCSHSIAECYSTLTRLLIKPRISPGTARQMIRDNILSKCKVVELSTQEYESALDFAVDKGISGASIYDILLYQAFRKSRSAKIATLNVKHYLNIFDGNIDRLVTF